jgi:thiol-disulfide isomerase/thioredoxin
MKRPTSFHVRRSLLALAAWPAWAPAQAGYEWRAWPPARPVPRLALPLLAGGQWSLAAEKGHPLLLNFWATWCEPCREELPALAALPAEPGLAGLKLLTVNSRDTRAKAERFVAEQRMALPVLLDEDGAAAKALDIHIFPTTLLVRRDGRILGRFVGDPGWAGADARARLAQLLQGPGR